eukprot:11368004-Karenia_brevis.AAC.1
MHGIENGIDCRATASLINDRQLDSYSQGCLRSILAGAVWSQDRMYRAGRSSSSRCPHCKKDDETVEHMWWSCDAKGDRMPWLAR